MPLAVEDICNQALRRIGYQIPLGFIYEGSRASRVAVEIYAQTRDDTMRANDYPFARREVAALLNGLPAPAPWLYEFAYPPDCLRVRQVMPATITTAILNDPQPILFTEFNDIDTGMLPPVRAVLANINPATLVYTGQITDPTTFDANYTEALIENLARRFAAALSGAPNMVQIEEALAETATDAALGSQVNRPPSPMVQRAQVGRQQRNE